MTSLGGFSSRLCLGERFRVGVGAIVEWEDVICRIQGFRFKCMPLLQPSPLTPGLRIRAGAQGLRRA